MAKFRKKPIVIEAIQFTGSNCYELSKWDKFFESLEHLQLAKFLTIQTLEGVHHADVGDWIIRGIKGELYPCKPDIFAATYEPTEPNDENVEEAKRYPKEVLDFVKFETRRIAHKKGWGHRMIPPTSDAEFSGVPEPVKWTDILTEEEMRELAKDYHP